MYGIRLLSYLLFSSVRKYLDGFSEFSLQIALDLTRLPLNFFSLISSNSLFLRCNSSLISRLPNLSFFISSILISRSNLLSSFLSLLFFRMPKETVSLLNVSSNTSKKRVELIVNSTSVRLFLT